MYNNGTVYQRSLVDFNELLYNNGQDFLNVLFKYTPTARRRFFVRSRNDNDNNDNTNVKK